MSDTPQDLNGPVGREAREALLGQRGGVVWLTGLSGSGKTTVTTAVEHALVARGVLTSRLDGDVVRGGINRDLGFSPEDRAENIRRVTELAHVMVQSGLVVLVAAISPYARDRQAARDRIGADRFVLVHVATPLDVCEQRDPKGLYKKARAGVLKDFTGISAPYEEPEDPDLRLRTDGSVDDAVAAVLTAVGSKIGKRD